jgi:hypothetical protein
MLRPARELSIYTDSKSLAYIWGRQCKAWGAAREWQSVIWKAYILFVAVE